MVCLRAAGAEVGGEVFEETEGPGLWAGASGYLHFLVSFRPLCPAEILHSTSYPTLSLTHTYKHTRAHKISTSTNTKRLLMLLCF